MNRLLVVVLRLLVLGLLVLGLLVLGFFGLGLLVVGVVGTSCYGVMKFVDLSSALTSPRRKSRGTGMRGKQSSGQGSAFAFCSNGSDGLYGGMDGCDW
jgi:hypothetical protein